MDIRTDRWTDGRTEFLPILQDFVPSRGRCPATLCDFKTAKRQGKGTADHMMPLGDWLNMEGKIYGNLISGVEFAKMINPIHDRSRYHYCLIK